MDHHDQKPNMTHYLQSSGIFGGLAMLTAFIVAIAGVLVLILAKSRRAQALAVISTGLPILVGGVGSLIGYCLTRGGLYDGAAAPSAEMIEAWQREILSPLVIGAALALPLFVCFGAWFVFRARTGPPGFRN